MSYFGEDLDRVLEDPSHCILEDAGPQEEVANGVTIERRGLLWLSATALGALLGSSSALRGQRPASARGRDASGSDPRLTYEQFLEQALPLARKVAASKGEDEEAYLMTVAAALCRLRDPAAPLRATMREFRRKHRQGDERFPLMAVSMRLEPGGGFSHHDHWDYNGIIMGIEGEVRIRNYDFQAEPPALDSGKTFKIRMTNDACILPGRISTLGHDRDNIHDLVAGPKGARVLDVFTFFTKHARSRSLVVEDEPRDREARIYEAAWKARRG